MTQPFPRLVAAFVTLALVASAATLAAQTDPVRSPLPAPVKVKQGMLNVPALSPLWLLPEYAAKYNIQIETVMFQRFADARTALASGDLDITAFGPQDISLAVGQGAKSLVGVAGVGSGNDCMLVRLIVELPRPRSLEVTMSPRFNELKREVLALIREESLRVAREG